MSSALVVSQIVLWIAVIGLSVLVFALARQVGVLHERIAPAGALAMNAVLKVDEKAPLMIEAGLTGETVEIGGVQKLSTLVFFLSPDCPICKTLLPALTSALHAERSWVKGVLASDGSLPEIHRDYVKQHSLEQFPYVVSEALGKRFGVSKLPYAVLIDETGVIRSLGMVNTREHIDSLFNAKDQGVSSIQEFIKRRNTTS